MLAFTRFEEQGQPVQEQFESVLLTGTGLVRYVPVDCDPPASPGEQGEQHGTEADTSEHNCDKEYDEPLTEMHLEDLSRSITTKLALRRLGINGLELPHRIIQSALTNNQQDIRDAAFKVLSEWWKRQADPVAAFNELVTTLRKCKMKTLASNLTEGARKRHSEYVTDPTSASPADASSISNSSHQQQEQRERADAAAVQSDDLPESLNAVHLVKLSHWITTETELRRLSIEGLKIPESNIQSALTNNRGNICAAAYRVLSTWQKKYEDESVAFRDLVAALEKCDMNQYTSQLKSQPRAGPSSAGSRTVTNRKSPKTPESEPLLAHPQVNTIKFIILAFFINFV